MHHHVDEVFELFHEVAILEAIWSIRELMQLPGGFDHIIDFLDEFLVNWSLSLFFPQVLKFLEILVFSQSIDFLDASFTPFGVDEFLSFDNQLANFLVECIIFLVMNVNFTIHIIIVGCFELLNRFVLHHGFGSSFDFQSLCNQWLEIFLPFSVRIDWHVVLNEFPEISDLLGRLQLLGVVLGLELHSFADLVLVGKFFNLFGLILQLILTTLGDLDLEHTLRQERHEHGVKGLIHLDLVLNFDHIAHQVLNFVVEDLGGLCLEGNSTDECKLGEHIKKYL